MSALSAVLAGRRAAEALMVDSVKIERVLDTVPDPLTGKDVTTYETVYEGKVKAQSFAAYEQNPVSADHMFTVQRLTLHIPVGAYRCQVGDVATIVESPVDPLLEDRQYRVAQEAPFKTFATSYRIFVDYIAD